MSQVEVRQLVKEYKRRKNSQKLGQALRSMFAPDYEVLRAVDSVDFSIEEGEAVGYVGPNGSGKPTTIKMLCGILKPTQGSVKINGLDPFKDRVRNSKGIGAVFGNRSLLWWDVPVIESYRLFQKLYDIPEKRFQENLEKFTEIMGLAPLLSIPERQLSLGQKMRCNIAAAFLHDPKIVFLDEPTIGLDILSQKKIREFLRIYNQQRKTTVIITSHYMADIEALCRRAVIINQGQLVYDGQLGDINRVLGERKLLSVKTSGEVNEKQWENFGRVREISAAGAVLEVPQEKVKAVLGAILSGLPVEDFTVTEIPIEESIARFYQKEVATI